MARPFSLLVLLACVGGGIAQGVYREHLYAPSKNASALVYNPKLRPLPDNIRKFTQMAYSQEEIDAFRTRLEQYDDNPVSAQCMSDTLFFVNDLNNGESYALQVLDSIGKPPAYLGGWNIVWLGGFDECRAIHAESIGPMKRSFQGKYCISQLAWFQVGICVSDACSKREVDAVLKIIFSSEEDESFNTRCAVPKDWSEGDILAMIITSLFIMMAILGTAMDVYLRLTKPKKPEKPKTPVAPQAEEPTASASSNDDNSQKHHQHQHHHHHDHDQQHHQQESGPGLDAPTLSSLTTHQLKVPGGHSRSPSIASAASSIPSVMDADENTQQHKAPEPEKHEVVELGTMWKVGLSFSWITNGSKVLAATKRKDNINCLNGLRVISLLWVLLGHTYAFQIGFYGNLKSAFDQTKMFSYQAVYNATFSVDTFFFISGLLTTYLTLKQLKKSKGKMNWGLFYFHRFWRLTPVYMFSMMFSVTIMLHIANGPFMRENDNSVGVVNCQKYWWANLLYINNFIPLSLEEQCFGHAWYLANDMQFYVISPLFIYLLYRFWRVGIVLVMTTLVGSLVTIGVVARIHEVMPTQTLWNPPNPWYDYLYVQPQYRIPPYLVGTLTAFLLYRYKGKLQLPKFVVLIGWMLAAACNLAVLYGLYHWNRTENVLMPFDLAAFYLSCGRFAWSLGLAWVVVACISGYGGPVDSLLSWSGWIPVVRLSYCAYLIHPMIFFNRLMGSRQRFYNHYVDNLWFFAAATTLVLLLALPVTLLVESPMMGLEKILLSVGKKPKKQKNANTEEQPDRDIGTSYNNRGFESEGTFEAPQAPVTFVVEPPSPDPDDVGKSGDVIQDAEAATYPTKNSVGNHALAEEFGRIATDEQPPPYTSE